MHTIKKQHIDENEKQHAAKQKTHTKYMHTKTKKNC